MIRVTNGVPYSVSTDVVSVSEELIVVSNTVNTTVSVGMIDENSMRGVTASPDHAPAPRRDFLRKGRHDFG